MIFIQLCLKKIVQICEMLGYFHAPWLLQSRPSTKGRYYSGESDLLRIFLWDYSVCWLQESWSRPASPLSPKYTLHEGTPLLFHTSFLLSSFVPFGARLPSNGVHKAWCFLCPSSYPIQSSATSESVSLCPISIEITAKVFIVLNGLRTLLSSGRQQQGCEDEFFGKFLHLLSDTEPQLLFPQEPSLIQMVIFAFQL